MFYELKKVENNNFDTEFEKMMAELNDFYGINWVENLPKIFLVDSRKQINNLWGRETDPWVVGWVMNTDVFVLKQEKMKTESSHEEPSDEKYYALIKHELSHCFTKISASFCKWTPKWLWEGVAIYTSGQLDFKEKIKEFNNFLSFYESGFESGVYKESGFAVEVLVNKFGKEKLLNLIKNLKQYQSKELFEKAFEEQYGFSPSYQKFNEMLN